MEVNRRAIVAGIAALAAPAIISTRGFAQSKVDIRIGYVTPQDGPHASAAVPFTKELEKLAPGRFNVQHFPGGSIGGERELAEALQLGSLDMAVIGTSVLGNFVTEFQVTEMPFLFRSKEHARGVLDGEIGKGLEAQLEPIGIKGLGMGEIGFRHITSTRVVRNMGDLKGLKIRVVENPVPVTTWKLLGALPTPMAFPEVYSALQQGVIDAQENPMSIIIPQRFWEPCKFMTLTGHGFTPIIQMFSKAIFDGLTDEDRQNIVKAARAGVLANRAHTDQIEADGLEFLVSHGVKVEKDFDRAAAEAAVQPVYDTYKDTLGKIVGRIKAAA